MHGHQYNNKYQGFVADLGAGVFFVDYGKLRPNPVFSKIHIYPPPPTYSKPVCPNREIFMVDNGKILL